MILSIIFGLSACGAGGEKTVEADLSDFYSGLEAAYELSGMVEADEDTVKRYYPGLEEIGLKQSIIRIPMISSVVSEFVFLQCETEGDAAAAAEILQARVDEQASGGAWYPATVKAWGRAAVLKNGSYVAMIAFGDNTESVAAEWEALFA